MINVQNIQVAHTTQYQENKQPNQKVEKRQALHKWCWENWTTTYKRMKLEYFLISYTKINSKCIKDLNVRPETIKLLEESIGRTLNDVNQRKTFYDLPPKVMEIKTKVNKWDLIKLKIFAQQRKL